MHCLITYKKKHPVNPKIWIALHFNTKKCSKGILVGLKKKIMS